ncbi:MAG: 30S ribosomal protein S6 [Bdellovibrionales bacterium]|nr:30S ribosomal protein S6 [Bdellovibrionales bacterium]
MFELKSESVIRPYEAIILMDPNTSEDEQKSLFQKNKKTIESFKGQMHNVDTWGTRKLANNIDKLTRAVYFHCTFTAGPDAINELERTMRINDKVLRFMHTRLPDTTELNSYLTKFKEALIERKERDAKRALAKAKKPMR